MQLAMCETICMDHRPWTGLLNVITLRMYVHQRKVRDHARNDNIRESRTGSSKFVNPGDQSGIFQFW